MLLLRVKVRYTSVLMEGTDNTICPFYSKHGFCPKGTSCSEEHQLPPEGDIDNLVLHNQLSCLQGSLVHFLSEQQTMKDNQEKILRYQRHLFNTVGKIEERLSNIKDALNKEGIPVNPTTSVTNPSHADILDADVDENPEVENQALPKLDVRATNLLGVYPSVLTPFPSTVSDAGIRGTITPVSTNDS